MAKSYNTDRKKFYVVQFMELPFEDIDDYQCVPYTWITRRAPDQKVIVAYPKDEDPFVTRDRAKRIENYDGEWRTYMALQKYTSDTYSDAEYWIATRNDYGPIVEEDSRMMDDQPQPTLDKKLRSAKQNRSSKSKNNKPQLKVKPFDKPLDSLPRLSLKRSAVTKLKKQLNEKQLKLDDAAKSTSSGVNNANIRSGCSASEQSITFQSNQSMNNTQTQEAATASNTKMVAGNPTEVMDCNEVQSNSVRKLTASSRQIQSVKQPESVKEQQISVAPSAEKTCDNQDVRIGDVSNNGLFTLHQLPTPLKLSDLIYDHMIGKPTLIGTQEPIKKNILLRNSARNLSIASQNARNLMDPTSSMSSQLKMMTQNQTQDSPQVLKTCAINNIDQRAPSRSKVVNSQIQHVFRINVGQSHEGSDIDPEKVLQSIAKVTSTSANQFNDCNKNLTNVKNELYQPSELSQQQNSHIPRVRVGISIKPKIAIRTPTLQGVAKRTTSTILSEVRNLIRQDLIATHNNYLLDRQRQRDKNMAEQHLSLGHGVTSDSESASDHEIISNYEMSADEAPVETRINDYTGISDRSNSAGRPMNAQNSTSIKQPMHPRAALEQQMLDQFGTLFEQMGTTLKHTSTLYNNLRRSILESADTYKRLLDSVETFNALSNLVSAAHSSSHTATEVPEVVQERHSGAAGREDSSDDDQHINDAVNEALNQRYNNSWRFVLPPEYDPHDSKWTLKYRKNMPGLIELLPQSGVYVSYDELKYAQRISNSCRSLARRLLPEVFSKRALSVCLSMNETPQASNNVGSQVRPSLDADASMVLFNFVLQQGHQRGWDTNTQAILSGIHSKVQQIRFKHGVMAQC